MLRLSTRARYGLRAMLKLPLHEGMGPVPLRDVADAQGVSCKYLGQLAIPLRARGLALSRRESNGGYELAKPAEEMTIFEVVEAADGPVGVLDCLQTPAACDTTGACAVRALWHRLNDAIGRILSETTLARVGGGSKGIPRRSNCLLSDLSRWQRGGQEVEERDRDRGETADSK